MNANNTLRTSYPHAARVCILLEVFKNQKLSELTPIFSTEFSTGEVESSRGDVSNSLGVAENWGLQVFAGALLVPIGDHFVSTTEYWTRT